MANENIMVLKSDHSQANGDWVYDGGRWYVGKLGGNYHAASDVELQNALKVMDIIPNPLASTGQNISGSIQNAMVVAQQQGLVPAGSAMGGGMSITIGDFLELAGLGSEAWDAFGALPPAPQLTDPTDPTGKTPLSADQVVVNLAQYIQALTQREQDFAKQRVVLRGAGKVMQLLKKVPIRIG